MLSEVGPLATDVAAAGHVVQRSAAGATDLIRSCDVVVVTAAALTAAVAADVQGRALLVVVSDRHRLPTVRRILRHAGLSRVELLGVDSLDFPTAAVTLGHAAASRWYVGRLASPWSAREVLRQRGERVLAAGPVRRRLYGGFLVVARRA